MRDYKFKAWDTEDERWMTPSIEDVEESELRLTVWGDILYRPSLEERIELGDGIVCGNERFILVQYTGIVDSKGEEVYDRSIVSGYIHKGTRDVVGDVWRNELDADYEIVVEGVFTGVKLAELGGLKVIGNEFEGLVK